MTAVFPANFLWGAATSAHQIEGNNTNSDWWSLEHGSLGHAGASLVKEPSGDAADSYHRWPEDMDLLAGAGFTDYRFSLEWARIEPAPGEISAAELAHYRRMIDGARDRGLRPLVTLHHFTNPLWFDQEGGWAGARAVERFVRYVDTVASILDDVDHVCTINEPHIAALMATVLTGGSASTDIGSIEPDPRASDALIEAHHKALPVLRGYRDRHRVGWSLACLNVCAEADAEKAAADYERIRFDMFAQASRGDDWVGVQAYTRTRVGVVDGRARALPPDSSLERTLTGWEYYPAALGDAVHAVAGIVGEVPIIVTENGIATDDDERRIHYTTEALASLEAAIADGIDVRGYFHWSLLDNYEWGSYRPTFGLVAVDRATFVRTPKPSLAWLGAQCPSSQRPSRRPRK